MGRRSRWPILHFQYVYGWSPARAGLANFPLIFTMIVATPVSESLAKRYGHRVAWQAPAVSELPPTFAEDVVDRPLQQQFEAFLDEHRRALQECLDGLTEEQARRSLVPSRTTLLGLVEHATFVEKVWFDQAVTSRSRAEIGLPATPDDSFLLDDGDTIESVRSAHRHACQASRRATSALGPNDVLRGNHRTVPLRWVCLHVLRELAQHCGHADILREQILAA